MSENNRNFLRQFEVLEVLKLESIEMEILHLSPAAGIFFLEKTCSPAA
jgi:hypothetical protein